MRTRKTFLVQSDAVSLAGWVYADLLLSLAIIFLTSISFDTPGDGDNSTPTTQVVANGSAPISNPTSKDIVQPITDGLTRVYTSFDKETLLKDIAMYKAENGLRTNARVVFAQIIGGYDAAKESSDQGTIRATAFVIGLHKANIPEFATAGLHISTSERIPSGYVMVRMSLAKYID